MTILILVLDQSRFTIEISFRFNFICTTKKFICQEQLEYHNIMPCLLKRVNHFLNKHLLSRCMSNISRRTQIYPYIVNDIKLDYLNLK